jgi:ribosome-binding protein aMBF1 (putative translation factor)
MAKAKKSNSGPSRARSRTSSAQAVKVDLGEMIRKARENAEVSQEELANRLETKRTAISRIENHAEDIKLSTLFRIAEALGKELKVRFA